MVIIRHANSLNGCISAPNKLLNMISSSGIIGKVHCWLFDFLIFIINQDAHDHGSMQLPRGIGAPTC